MSHGGHLVPINGGLVSQGAPLATWHSVLWGLRLWLHAALYKRKEWPRQPLGTQFYGDSLRLWLHAALYKRKEWPREPLGLLDHH